MGHLEEENLYLFDCMFAGILRGPGLKEKVCAAEAEYDHYMATNTTVEQEPSA